MGGSLSDSTRAVGAPVFLFFAEKAFEFVAATLDLEVGRIDHIFWWGRWGGGGAEGGGGICFLHSRYIIESERFGGSFGRE